MFFPNRSFGCNKTSTIRFCYSSLSSFFAIGDLFNFSVKFFFSKSLQQHLQNMKVQFSINLIIWFKVWGKLVMMSLTERNISTDFIFSRTSTFFLTMLYVLHDSFILIFKKDIFCKFLWSPSLISGVIESQFQSSTIMIIIELQLVQWHTEL